MSRNVHFASAAGLLRRCVKLLLFATLATVFCLRHAFAGEVARDKEPHARVLTVHDDNATQAFHAQADVVRTMVARGLTNLTGMPTGAAAWRSLVSTQDIIGIKVFSVPGPNSGTRPAVVAGVIEGLLAAGVPATNIIVWDKKSADLRVAGFYELAQRYGVQVAGSFEAGYDLTNYYASPIIGDLVYGDVEFDKKGSGIGRRSFVSKLLSQEITKNINVTPLLNNNVAGVAGNLYGLASGSVDNFARFEADPARLSRAAPEIYALPALSDHVVLNIVDALICQYEGSERSLLHYSTQLNELRFSRDPVALDVLSLKELEKQRQAAGAPAPKPNLELYGNASLLELGISDLKRIDLEVLR